MKCLRILPEMWARMTCLLESSTRNMAFGRVSRTTPSASNMSCLGIGALLEEGCPRPGGGRRPRAQDLRSVPGHGHRVLKMGRAAPVPGPGRPAVIQYLVITAAGGDHVS